MKGCIGAVCTSGGVLSGRPGLDAVGKRLLEGTARTLPGTRTAAVSRPRGRPYDGRPGGLRTGSPPSPPPRSIRPQCGVSRGPRACRVRVPIEAGGRPASATGPACRRWQPTPRYSAACDGVRIFRGHGACPHLKSNLLLQKVIFLCNYPGTPLLTARG